VKLLFEVFIGV